MKKWVAFLASIVAFSWLAWRLVSPSAPVEAGGPIVIYCAAGVRLPVESSVKAFGRPVQHAGGLELAARRPRRRPGGQAGDGVIPGGLVGAGGEGEEVGGVERGVEVAGRPFAAELVAEARDDLRSEERRVGKECRL